MKFQEYINEKSPDEKKILSQIKNWKSDLRKLTKMFRDLDVPETPKEIKEWKKLRKYFFTFRENFEKFFEYLLVTDYKEENWYERQAREKLWSAIMSINNVFEDGYDIYLEKHGVDIYKTLREREKTISRYNRMFREAFKAVNEMLEFEDENIKRKELFQDFNYAGVRIELEYNKETEVNGYSYKGLVKFLKEIKSMLKTIENKGLKVLLKDLKIKLSLKGEGNAAGKYESWSDTVIMTAWGLGGSDAEYIFYHEIGHRYWNKILPKKQRERWESALQTTKIRITDKHISDFVNKYFPFDKVPGIKDYNVNTEDYRNFYMINKESSENVAVFTYFIENFPYRVKKGIKKGDVDKENVKDVMKETLLGNTISSQLITNYANKNADEAWSEAIAIWLKYSVNRLPEKIRYLFKKIFSDMGVTINEKVNNMKFKVYLKEGMDKYPKGWTKESIKKFVKTLSDSLDKDVDEKGWFSACVNKMKDEMGDGAKGFCASLLDEYKGTTKWRGKHKE